MELTRTSCVPTTVEVWQQGWLVAEARGQEVKGGKVLRGVIALAIGAAILSSGAFGVSAQDQEGAGDVESAVAAGTLDDGQALLPLTGIGLDAAIRAARGAASGAAGEVDLKHVGDRLVFNVDIGAHDEGRCWRG
jgi:uncharacterized membrane protein YkoI